MSSLRKKKTKHYLAMWDSQGLECLFDVGFYMDQYNEWEKQKVISILKEERTPDQPRGVPLQMMILRAKANSQRAYEIYEFNSTMAYDELKEAFEIDPQPIVEWIRVNGKKVYSDYLKQDRKMIV